MNDRHRIRVVFLHAAFPEILRTGVLHLHALETVEMTNPIEQQARELLALGLDEYGHHNEAENVRNGEDLDSYRVELFALNIALTRALSAPDNAEAVCPNCDRLTEIRHCQACGCDFASPSTAATADNAEAMFHLRSYGDVTERELLELANPTPAARVSVSDLKAAEWAADYCTDMGFPNSAAAIRRLVQAVKGEG